MLTHQFWGFLASSTLGGSGNRRDRPMTLVNGFVPWRGVIPVSSTILSVAQGLEGVRFFVKALAR
jgi:hypothetical protein